MSKKENTALAMAKPNCSCLGSLSSLPWSSRHRRHLHRKLQTNDCKWSTLPHDLLLLIASKLPLPHNLRLRQVCSSWATAFKSYAPLARGNLPWLILPNSSGEHNFTLLYSQERKSVPLPFLPKKEKIWCVGYKNGWLVIVHKLQILLLNLLTREQLRFPSFYNQQGVDHDAVPCVGKVILSSTTKSAAIFAMAMTDDYNLAYAKQTDRKWTPLRVAPGNFIHDIEHHDVGRFCILYDGPVIGAEFFADMRNFNVSAFKISYEYADRLQKSSLYLASSPTGDLLQILGIRDSDSRSHNCEKYIVKILRGSESQWVEIEDLGGWSVFMDTLQCTFLPAREAGGLRENCIYIAKNVVTSDNEVLIDAGVFDIGRGIIEHGFPNMLHLEELRSVIPLWLTPSLS